MQLQYQRLASMPFGKYSSMIRDHGEDLLIGTEIRVDMAGMYEYEPLFVSESVDSAGEIRLKMETSQANIISSSKTIASGWSQGSAFGRLRQMRSMNKPGALRLDLSDVSSYNSFSDGRAGRIISPVDCKIDEFTVEKGKAGEMALPCTPQCVEVLIDRSQKGKQCFFPPSVHSSKTNSNEPRVFPLFMSSKEENVHPKHSEPNSSTKRESDISDTRTEWLGQQRTRTYESGDRVDIVGGENRGKTGTIVHSLGDNVHVFVDFQNKTWSMPVESVQPHVFIPGSGLRSKKRADPTPNQSTKASSSIFFSLQQSFRRDPSLPSIENQSMYPSSFLDDDSLFSSSSSPSTIYNISSDNNFREGKVVQVIEGPQRQRVGKILRVATEAIQVLVDGSNQPCFFSPSMLRDLGNRALC